MILSWYKKNQRDLPWRNTKDPYKILVSEIMLQQTQVSRVLPKYDEFLLSFPAIESLANANDAKLLQVWSGLGYWRRARMLKETAQEITKKYKGKFPRDHKTLQTLSGIGPYTAGALACFAFNDSTTFIDTNIRKVYIHFFFPNTDQVSDKNILPIAQKAVYTKDPRAWHWALFDYGSQKLKAKNINRKSKHYTKQSTFKGSFRSYRARAIKHLLALPKQEIQQIELIELLEDKLRKDERDFAPQEIIDALLKDNLMKKSKNTYYV